MPEQPIRFDPGRLLPWVAISIAAHGLLLYDGSSSTIRVPQGAGGDTMQVRLLPSKTEPAPAVSKSMPAKRAESGPGISAKAGDARKKNVTDQTKVMATHSPVTIPTHPVISDESVASASQAQADRTPAINSAAAEASPSPGDTQARKARQSRVRSHLEQYKYYPATARRRGIEGEVELDFALNEQGQANSISIVAGSGYAVLDQAARQTVRRAEPFPADGGEYRCRLRFSRL